MAFSIVLSPAAMDHLSAFKVRERRIVLDAIQANLKNQPSIITKQRRPMRPNALASWELRVGQVRVFYQVQQNAEPNVVYVVAVGRKIRDRLMIGGVEVKL